MTALLWLTFLLCLLTVAGVGWTAHAAWVEYWNHREGRPPS